MIPTLLHCTESGEMIVAILVTMLMPIMITIDDDDDVGDDDDDYGFIGASTI